ncbi:MAG: SusC/RagA family TonB-linked outer membrane protein, partial [Bacteroidales bacterium]
LQNPVGIINRSDRKETRDRVFGNLYAQWQIVEGLTLKTDFGYDYTNWFDKWFQPSVPEPGRSSKDSALEEYKRTSVRWLNTTTLRYDKTFETSKLQLLGGFSYESYDIQKSKVKGTDFLSEDPSQRYMSSAGRIQYALGDRAEWALQSFFARADYSLKDRYIFSANVRVDGSSKFAKENRYGIFPSFSGAWRISEEKFFAPALNYVENLKLRASWGMLGNQNIYDFYPTYSKIGNTIEEDTYDPVFGTDENIGPGKFESNVPNKNIKWETTQQYNIGLDVSFLKNFDLVFDYFNKETSDVLVEVPLPSLAGVSTNPYVNAAKIRNRGWELNLTYSNQAGAFNYSVYGNLSSVKNKVLALGDDNSAIYHSSYRGDNISRTKVGDPMAHFYGYKTDGIFKTDAEAQAYVNQFGKPYQPSAKAGDLKYLDLDGDGSINGDDRTNIGNGFPDLTYGFGANLGYKGFDLSFAFQGVAGFDIYNALKWEGTFVKPEYNQYAAIMDRFHPTNNPNGTLPRATISDPNNNKRASDYYVEKGDYLRLKNLTVGYTFKGEWMQKLRIQNMRVYATAQNLFTITKYSGLDPELGETYADDVDSFGVREIGVDRGQFPQARSYIMGVSVNF